MQTSVIITPVYESDYVVERKHRGPVLRVIGKLEERIGMDYKGDREGVVRLHQGSLLGLYVRVSTVDKDAEKQILGALSRGRIL